MKVLFVCLGNICRSPTAEAIFRKKFLDQGIQAFFDSAGTANYHVGEKSDHRSIHHAEKKGYSMTHLGRQVQTDDFTNFDIILAMDKANFHNLQKMCVDPSFHTKIKMVTEYCKDSQHQEVPDPYYGTSQDFELVIEILEKCVDNFIDHHFRNY